MPAALLCPASITGEIPPLWCSTHLASWWVTCLPNRLTLPLNSHPQDPNHHPSPSTPSSSPLQAIPQYSHRLYKPKCSSHQLEEQKPKSQVQYTPVRRTAPAALPEARLVLASPEEDSGFTIGQAGSRDQRPYCIRRPKAPQTSAEISYWT